MGQNCDQMSQHGAQHLPKWLPGGPQGAEGEFYPPFVVFGVKKAPNMEPKWNQQSQTQFSFRRAF